MPPSEEQLQCTFLPSLVTSAGTRTVRTRHLVPSSRVTGDQISPPGRSFQVPMVGIRYLDQWVFGLSPFTPSTYVSTRSLKKHTRFSILGHSGMGAG